MNKTIKIVLIVAVIIVLGIVNGARQRYISGGGLIWAFIMVVAIAAIGGIWKYKRKNDGDKPTKD